MKKLVIAAAIAMAAVVSQASAINWQTDMMLVDHAGQSVAMVPTITAVCTIWDATGANALYTTDPAVGSDFFAMFSGSWDSASPNTGYQAQLVITDASGWTLTSEKAAFTTDAADPFVINFSTGLGFTTETAKLINSGTNNGWVSAVPEPTSGLLLLLGVAGLALRRRRA